MRRNAKLSFLSAKESNSKTSLPSVVGKKPCVATNLSTTCTEDYIPSFSNNYTRKISLVQLVKDRSSNEKEYQTERSRYKSKQFQDIPSKFAGKKPCSLYEKTIQEFLLPAKTARNISLMQLVKDRSPKSDENE